LPDILPDIDTWLLQELKSVTLQAADIAGKEAMKWFRNTDLEVKNKSYVDASFDPVTMADTSVEKAMIDIIRSVRPHDTIHGEESGLAHVHSHCKTDITWNLDPIDGTRSFVAGLPLWGNLISVSAEGKSFIGLINIPCTGERVYASLTCGNTDVVATNLQLRQKMRMRTSQVEELKNAVIMTTHPEHFPNEHSYKMFCKVASCAKISRFGGDCYQYFLLAGGFVDIVMEAGLQSYDIQPMIPIIRASGGMISDWHGNDDCENGGSIVACSNKTLHAEVLSLLSA